ncbi:hypothetical protein CSC94_22555 [Zhengella mangrovi]|uniref:Carbon monoxide dehydrogenase n=1 Tax=Zhengella mangrovi TaxID=1982044 RepID=A0A2G1QH56_9HYPH|nr:SRPBCC domain-containing protein [Zhengella mangrovi]PHP64784.1 hypothetical protein CSC94_22555 [Zhengella mangrovi]
MDIELKHDFAAPADRLWTLLLDPHAMANCVPGMQSVEVVSDTEYVARMKVKIAFISASFTIRTVITEQTSPDYLRCESTGEDSAVGSSVKSINEMFLIPDANGGTSLRVKSKATVFGRLGTLGLNPMRTKADRLWVEFCAAVEKALEDAGSGQETQRQSIA